jgi:hypothetical protein
MGQAGTLVSEGIMKLTASEVERLPGRELYAMSGEKIGEIESIFIDERTAEPEWLRLSFGLFGRKDVLVPVESVIEEEGAFKVPFTRELLREAPDIDGDYVTPEQESELYRHYGVAEVSPSELNEERGSPSDAIGEPTPVQSRAGENPAATRSVARDVPEEEALTAPQPDNPRQRRLVKWRA